MIQKLEDNTLVLDKEKVKYKYINDNDVIILLYTKLGINYSESIKPKHGYSFKCTTIKCNNKISFVLFVDSMGIKYAGSLFDIPYKLITKIFINDSHLLITTIEPWLSMNFSI